MLYARLHSFVAIDYNCISTAEGRLYHNLTDNSSVNGGFVYEA